MGKQADFGDEYQLNFTVWLKRVTIPAFIVVDEDNACIFGCRFHSSFFEGKF